MGNIIDMKTRKEYIPNKVAEAGNKAGEQYRKMTPEFIKQLKAEQKEIDVLLTSLEKELGLPGPQLRLL